MKWPEPTNRVENHNFIQKMSCLAQGNRKASNRSENYFPIYMNCGAQTTVFEKIMLKRSAILIGSFQRLACHALWKDNRVLCWAWNSQGPVTMKK
jgi:hypothetical protein